MTVELEEVRPPVVVPLSGNTLLMSSCPNEETWYVMASPFAATA